jgi:adenine phosphoribosyltransferase
MRNGNSHEPARHEDNFAGYCRDVPDFPKKGIVFKDITTLLKNGPVFKRAIDLMAEDCRRKGVEVVVSIEARGFIIGSALAYCLGVGLVPVRKKGKLPWRVYRESYALEYGQDQVEVHQDAIAPGQNVLIVDDVIATGGTAEAVAKLVTGMKGKIVGAAFLIELSDLNGREKLKGVPIFSIIKCP